MEQPILSKCHYGSVVKVVDFQSGRILVGQVTARVDVPYIIVNVYFSPGLEKGSGLPVVQIPFNGDDTQVVGRNQGIRFRIIEKVY